MQLVIRARLVLGHTLVVGHVIAVDQHGDGQAAHLSGLALVDLHGLADLVIDALVGLGGLGAGGTVGGVFGVGGGQVVRHRHRVLAFLVDVFRVLVVGLGGTHDLAVGVEDLAVRRDVVEIHVDRHLRPHLAHAHGAAHDLLDLVGQALLIGEALLFRRRHHGFLAVGTHAPGQQVALVVHHRHHVGLQSRD
ncbi:hypothetical protein AZA_87582 [Nitrospirillum viridazoti Y2]|nr:hypothetical protein AZA_87582 [Nitrospirillum amazonense Y2]